MIRCRRNHCADVENIVRAIYTSLNGIIVHHISPYDLQSRTHIFLQKLLILLRRSCKNPCVEPVASSEELLHRLLPHGSRSSCHKHNLLRSGRIVILFFPVKRQRCVKCFPRGIERSSCHCCIAHFIIPGFQRIARFCQGASIPLLSPHCENSIIAGILRLISILLPDYFMIPDLFYRYSGYRRDSLRVNALSHADLPRTSHISAEFVQHLKYCHLCPFLRKILRGLHADHSAAYDDHISCSLLLSIQNIMGLNDKCTFTSRNRRSHRFCTYSINHSMRFNLSDQFRCHRRIQANLNTQPLRFLRHGNHRILHFFLSGRLSRSQELASQNIRCLAENRMMPSLLQNDRRLKSCDSAACHQNSFRFLCRCQLTFCLPSHCRVS